MIAEAINRYVKSSGIKQNFLAEKTGMSPTSISEALKGRRKISIDEYQKICNALAVPYEFFFSTELPAS